MLAGEYAVLFGKKALVYGVDRRAHCTYSRALSTNFSSITTHSERNNEHPLFLSVKKACAAHLMAFASGSYTVDTSAFFSTHKLGLGSSAAATVALTAMVLQQNNINDPTQLFDIARIAHRQVFGFGSGADIAASIHGGIIEYVNVDDNALIKPCTLPTLVENGLIIATHRPQNTSDFVKCALDFAARAPDEIKRFADESDRLCVSLRNAKNEDETRIAIEQLYVLLKDFGIKANIPIVSDVHARIHDIAKEFSGSAKPSGAGGGDVALAFVPKTHHARFATKLSSMDCSIIATLQDAS